MSLSRRPLVELIVADRDGQAPEPDPHVEQLAAPWRVAEARALAARVRELIDTAQARAREVVVLLRATTDMHVYEQALEAAGVPTYVIGGRGYWSHPQVIELVAYLRALANPRDAEALHTVRLSPLCGLSLDGLVLTGADARDELSLDDRMLLRDFEAWFERERRAATWLGAEELLDRALLRNGYELHLAGLPDARRRLANVRKLMRLAREWQQQHGSDLRGFVDQLRSRADGGDGSRESEAPVESEALDAVRLMTIHRSKGLEFPVVCVADLGRQVLPRAGALVRVGRDGQSLGLRLKRPGHGQRVSVLAYDELKAEERERELQEERRLFYVAMTRAKERLIISGSARLDNWHESNRFAPIGWVGSAFVPDIAARATAAAAADAQGLQPEPFTTELGMLVRFVGSTAPVATSPGKAAFVDAGGLFGSQARKVPQDPIQPAEPRSLPASPTLSYTALSTYEQCGYRFYVQRLLGLPDLPTPAPVADEDAEQRVSLRSAPPRAGLSGTQRGTLIHQLLATMDLRNPSLRDPMPADVRALLAGLVGSTTFSRLSGLRDVRREQRFSFPIGETLITGVFDVIAQDRPNHLLVLDYKSDRLAGADPWEVVAERYLAQRTIYALAALKLGASSVEVVHLFLEAPEDPVSAEFAVAEVPILEGDLAGRVAGPLTGDFRVTDAPGRSICDGCPAQGGLCSYPLELTTR